MNIEMKLQSYGDVECRVPLSKRTTFRIGGTCKYFIYPKNELCLLRILDILEEEGIPHRIFGKGSNILCSDDDYEGAILCLDRYFTDFFFEEEGSCLVQAGASIIMLAHEAMKKSFSGLEFASGIPGTLGGAVFMNAGAYKSDISQILKEVYILKDRYDSCYARRGAGIRIPPLDIPESPRLDHPGGKTAAATGGSEGNS